MKKISTEELKAMADNEGLILQGCGGDLDEWVSGITEMLVEEGIIRNGSTFAEVYIFKHDGLTNLLFPLDGVDMDMGKLAMWRLHTRDNFGGTWLSDYLPNRLGFTPQEQPAEPGAGQARPKCPIIGADGNIFTLMSMASRTLRQNDMDDQAEEMRARITSSSSYDEALVILMEYVEPADEQGMEDSINDDDMDMDDMQI